MEFVEGGLVGGLDDQLIDIDVVGTSGNPHQNLSDILADEWFGPFIDFLCFLDIALETKESL